MSFLSDIADHLLTAHPDHLGDCTVVFPNRRAGLFLKKELSRKLEHPVWSPTTLSLEDYLFSFSSIKKADSLTLIFELYACFLEQQGQSTEEGFDAFYHWGEMLLRDFEEVDHYLIDPAQVFTLVKDDRQLAESFYFLDEEQEKIIQNFWKDFFPVATKTQKKFMETWEILLPVYEAFKHRIKEKQVGYTSHIYRDLTDHLEQVQPQAEKRIIFAGFNALTPVEEVLIKHLIVQHNAEIHWDIDDYYLNDENQEAGDFFRRYQQDPVFKSTFPDHPNQTIAQPKQIDAVGVSLEIGQTKAVSEHVEALLETGAKPEEIVIVLPQDYMLFPVLNAIPETVEKLNVTMGYPLRETPLFGLLEASIELQEHLSFSSTNGLSFYHKPTMDVLCHPYLYKEDKNPIDKLIADIKRKNRIRIFQDEILDLNSTLLNTIFRQVGSDQSVISYLLEIVSLLNQQVVELFGLEREFLYHFQQMLHRLDEILERQTMQVQLKTIRSLFRKVSGALKVPFSGEPVEGLQVMGVLETRNLDFKHVLMLNMNEGIFPAPQRQGSFIPYRIRKAFDLPTHEVQDSIYAYLFYRLLQRSEQVSYYYNMYADFGLSGEISRFVRQLELESGLDVRRKKLSNTIQQNKHSAISIDTTINVVEKLQIYTNKVPERDQRRLSASALNTYLECKLRFYFRYVLRLFTSDTMSDDLDARHFGNALHKTLEYLYLDTMQEKGSRVIDENDFFRLESSIDGAIEKAFKEEFGMRDKKRFEFKDRNVVMAEVIRNFVRRMLEMDKDYAPFEIVSLEDEDKYERFIQVQANGETFGVKLGADIDRVDRKEGRVRVVDYKTGRDETDVGAFENLFSDAVHYKYRSARKAGYQTFFYAWLYASKHGSELPITPGLINMKQIFQSDFDFRLRIDGAPLDDARGHLNAFEGKLSTLLEAIFNQDVPFDQTEDESKCVFCDFRGMCDR